MRPGLAKVTQAHGFHSKKKHKKTLSCTLAPLRYGEHCLPAFPHHQRPHLHRTPFSFAGVQERLDRLTASHEKQQDRLLKLEMMMMNAMESSSGIGERTCISRSVGACPFL